ncbi:MAG: ATP-binding protein, partial [Acidimicrobiia bacterium]
LTGLDSSGVAAFMEQAAGHAIGDEELALARAVYEETEGNPFFVREVFRHLTESGAMDRREGRWITRLSGEELGIPESVKDVVGRRLARLSGEANLALRTAAVVGPEFEVPVLQAAGGLDEDALLASLEEAAKARLIIESGARYRFSHALVRDTLYGELSAARQVSLHRRVAEAIESVHSGRLDDHLPALAHHWVRAGAPAADTARAVNYATRAGDQALAQLAHDEAVAYYRQALELLAVTDGPPDEGHRLELLIVLGDAQRRAADPGSRDTLLEAVALARARGDADALARAALANTRGAFWSALGTINHERVAALEAALRAAGEAPKAVRARLLATLGMELVFTPDRARRLRLSDESLRIARSLGDAATLVHVLMARVWTINAPDTLAERISGTAELLILADDLDDPLVKFIAHFLRARVTLESGEVEDGGHHLRRAQALATELGQPTLLWMAGWLTVGHLLLAGKIDEADRAAQEAYEIGQSSGQPDAGLVFLLQRSVIRFEQGRLGELEPELSEMCARFPALPGLAAVLAAAYCQLDRDEDARSELERLRAISFDLPRDTLWLGFLTLAADVACRLDDQAAASMLYDRLRSHPAVSALLAGVSTGCAAHYLGMLAAIMGRQAEAEEQFRPSAATYEKVGAPGCLARARLEWARVLLTRHQPGDPERARELLGQALATARELGLANVERRAVELLR